MRIAIDVDSTLHFRDILSEVSLRRDSPELEPLLAPVLAKQGTGVGVAK
jgi:hypothetical protein